MPSIFPPRVPCIKLPPFNIRSEGASSKHLTFQGFSAKIPVGAVVAENSVVLPVSQHEHDSTTAAVSDQKKQLAEKLERLYLSMPFRPTEYQIELAERLESLLSE
jgi:hypothetical protein